MVEQALLIGGVIVGLIILVVLAIFGKWGSLWLQAYMSSADVSMLSLISMSILKIDKNLIVSAKVMAFQSGIPIDRMTGMSTARLQAHHLAGGHVMDVVKAVIAASRANIPLDFERAAAIDLAGRNVLQAVQTSILPVVIHCPISSVHGKQWLSAVAKNGVELLVSARVTVRTNLEQLIGGATEETIIARVGQGIITAIGSANSHMDVLSQPSQISEGAMARGLDANTAFSIVSIDIADIDVGKNIGARLMIDQADADMRTSQAESEGRRAMAMAELQEMRALTANSRSSLLLAEARLPAAMANAFRAGNVNPVKRPAATAVTVTASPPPVAGPWITKLDAL